MIEDNLGLIRKIVWSYVKGNPGLEFDDLFQEACVAYLEAQSKYDPSRGKESTFYWWVVNNRLRTLLSKNNKRVTKEITTDDDFDFSLLPSHPSAEQDAMRIEEEAAWEAAMANLSPEAQYIKELAIRGEEHLVIRYPQRCKKQIANTLIEQGWKWNWVWRGFKEIKAAMV